MKKVADELRQIVADVVPKLRSIADHPDLAVRPRPAKWARKEILGHLIDSACNNQQNLSGCSSSLTWISQATPRTTG